MKDLLAQKLLAAVTAMSDPAELVPIRQKLQALGATKYDDYDGYTPGVKFIESLAGWLGGFAVKDRTTALQFVLERLVYVSAAEMDHLVSTVYHDILRPAFRSRAAAVLGVPHWQISRIRDSAEFQSIQRRTLVLGLSDGARLDRLRRSSELSTEQFHLDYVVQAEKAAKMQEKLADALAKQNLPGDATFQTVIVVDDFSGSGATMLRPDGAGWDGKVVKVLDQVDQLRAQGVVAEDATVIGLLYLMTARAKRDLAKRLQESELASRFRLEAAHVFEESFPLTAERDAEFWELCSRYFRPGWADEHTNVGGSIEHGFGGAALPLVLHHNAPNNAPPIVWKEEAEPSDPYDTAWVGLFPRHERHHPGRP